jgi:hypothetical protein
MDWQADKPYAAPAARRRAAGLNKVFIHTNLLALLTTEANEPLPYGR